MQFCFRKIVSSSLWFCKPFAFHWAILRNLVVLIVLVDQHCEHIQYHAIVLEQLIEQSFEFVCKFRQYGGCVFDLVCAAPGHICVASWLQVAARLHVVVVCVGMCWVATRMRVVVVCVGVYWLCALCAIPVRIGFFQHVVVMFAHPVVFRVIASAQCACCWCVFTLFCILCCCGVRRI